jgi:restriction endonuclease S subunit
VGNFFTNDSWYYSDLDLEADKYCDNGDLLYAWSASFAPKIWNGGKVIYHYHIWKILVDASRADKSYLYYFLEWDVENIKSSKGSGSTMIHVTKGAIEQRAIRLPPIEEQRRIAEVLSSVDQAIAAQSEVHEQTEIMFNCLATACFAAGNEAADNVWPIYPLGDLCESIQVGIVVRPASYYVETGGIPALRSLNVGENYLNLDDLVYISTEGHRLNNKSSLRPGDVVTRRTGEPGKTAVIPPLFPDGLNCIDIIFSRPTGRLRAEFLSFFMNSDAAKRQVTGLQGGACAAAPQRRRDEKAQGSCACRAGSGRNCRNAEVRVGSCGRGKSSARPATVLAIRNRC